MGGHPRGLTILRRHPNHRQLDSLPPELRRTGVPRAVRGWVQRELGQAVVAVRRLPGASSAAVHRVDLADGRRAVVRRYVWPGFTEEEPDAPAREAEALLFASVRQLPVPKLLASDVHGTAVGDGVPALLMEHLAGQPRPDPDPDRLAGAAAAVHSVDPAGFDHRYFPWCREEMVAPPPGARHPETWLAAIEIWHNAEPAFAPVLIHRDFHPGNVLWWRTRLTGIVDWANACAGPPGVDVATCSRNLRAWAGPDAARAFVGAYEAITGTAVHPYWQLAGILEAGSSHWTPDNVAEVEPDLARLVSLLR